MEVAEEDKELEAIKQRMLKELMKEREVEKVVDRPLEVTDADFDQFVKRAPVVVVDCWATWCPPCRMLAPVIDELAKRLAGRVLFGKLDVDVNPATVAKYAIMEVPTLLVFKDGKFMGKIIGFRPLPELERMIKAYL